AIVQTCTSVGATLGAAARGLSRRRWPGMAGAAPHLARSWNSVGHGGGNRGGRRGVLAEVGRGGGGSTLGRCRSARGGLSSRDRGTPRDLETGAGCHAACRAA